MMRKGAQPLDHDSAVAGSATRKGDFGTSPPPFELNLDPRRLGSLVEFRQVDVATVSEAPRSDSQAVVVAEGRQPPFGRQKVVLDLRGISQV
jgi:hypothetical protein